MIDLSAVTFGFRVLEMTCRASYEGLRDVVYVVTWQRHASLGDVSVCGYGTTTLAAPTGGAFVPYLDLTEAAVVGWIEAATPADELAAMDADLVAQIDAIINPTVVTPPLPWAMN